MRALLYNVRRRTRNRDLQTSCRRQSQSNFQACDLFHFLLSLLRVEKNWTGFTAQCSVMSGQRRHAVRAHVVVKLAGRAAVLVLSVHGTAEGCVDHQRTATSTIFPFKKPPSGLLVPTLVKSATFSVMSRESVIRFVNILLQRCTTCTLK